MLDIMTNKLIGALIAIVIGLALLPVVVSFVETAEESLEGGVETLVGLLPILYVIMIIGGAVGYLSFKK